MAGYDDTYQMIISTLMGRPVGTEIQPDSQQAYEINMLNYIRSLELIANGPLIGIAEANTQPIQPNDARACYIAGVAQDRTVTFQNFRNYLGQPIQITNGQMEACLVILIWDTQYWSATQVPTNIISAAEQANFYYSYNIRKTYASISAMNADSTNPIGTDGKYINVGDLVSVVNTSNADENGFYSRIEDGWQLQSGFNFEVVEGLGQNVNSPISQNSSSVLKFNSDTSNSFKRVRNALNYREQLLTSVVRNVRLIFNNKQDTTPVIALALFRKNANGTGEIRFKYKLPDGTWSYCFYTPNDVPVEVGKTTHFDYSYGGSLGNIRAIFDVDYDLIEGNISTFIYASADDLQVDPMYVLNDSCFYYGDLNQLNSDAMIQEVSDLTEKVTEMSDDVMENSAFSFVRVLQPRNENELKYSAAIRNVKLTIVNESLLPANIDLDSIAVGLIRRGYTQGTTIVNSNQIRFSYKTTESGSVREYLSLAGYVSEDLTLPDGFNHVKFTEGGIQFEFDVNWNVFPKPSSISIFGSITNEPTFVVDRNRIVFFDINNINNNTYRENLSVGAIKSFVPSFGTNIFNAPAHLFIIKTPYLISEEANLGIKLLINTAGSAGSAGSNSGKFNIMLNFWLFRDAMNYYTPNATYSIPINTPEIPIRLAVNSDNYVCIVLGSDDVNFYSLGYGGNVAISIEEVLLTGSAGIRKTGWSATNVDSLSNEYTSITNVASKIAPKPTTSLPPVFDSNLHSESIPLDSDLKTSGQTINSAMKYKIALPEMYSPSLNAYYDLLINVQDIDVSNGKGVRNARIAFWGRSNSTLGNYGICYKETRVDFNISVALLNGRYYVIIDFVNGVVPGNTIISVTNFKVYTATATATATGWKTSVVEDGEFDEATAVYVPKVVTIATLDDLNNAISSQSVSVVPTKPSTFAVFGSSKSTTRRLSEDTGWVGKLLSGLLGKAGLIQGFTTNVTPTNGNTTKRRFSNSYQSKKINGVGSYLEFSTFGNNVVISQVISRTSDYSTFDIFADDEKIGSFDNINPTLNGVKTIQFTGNGTQRSFFIPDLCSYNFIVKVDGVDKSVSMNPSQVGGTSSDCYAVRTIMSNAQGEVKRILYFPTPPTGTIDVTYEVGDLIAYAISDYRTLDSGADENEYPVYISDVNSTASYQSGYPLMPMICDERGLIRINFGTYKSRKIRIQITGGVNPYFDFDFAVSEYFSLMNAAFGGYDVPRVINEGRWRDWRCLRYFFNPEKLFMEYGTNDDRYQIDRVLVNTKQMTLDELKETKMKMVKSITKTSDTTLDVGVCTGIIQSITPFSITSDDIKNSDIQVGDYLRIGEYHSSWHEFVIRRISAVDKVAGTVTWVMPFNTDTIWHYNSLEDMSGAQFAVRRLGQFKTNMRTAITKMKDALPETKIYLIGMSAFRDNAYCSGWGYNESLQDLAKEFDCDFINISDEQIRYNEGALIDANELEITSTGASTYTVNKDSIDNQNREFRVLVNGKDVTGISAYIEINKGWHVNDNATIDDVSLLDTQEWNRVTQFSSDVNRDIDIVFYKDIPTSSDSIKLIWGKTGWSDDGVHQTVDGNITYSDSILRVL